MKKLIYLFDPISSEYTGEDYAIESPREPGIFLLPAYSTDIKPPKLPSDSETILFDTNTKEWKVVAEHRGKYYDTRNGSEIEWLDITEKPLESLFVKTAPPSHVSKPKWNEKDKTWIETAKKFKGIVVENEEQVNQVTKQTIKDLDEDQIKTLKLIAIDEGKKCPEWDKFLKDREKILKEKDDFLKEKPFDKKEE